ncbi:hypothetical protein PsYK624_108300 [Phanerochaete sordida]|uniref:Uncharacterized protein n=1 Tax=Phanerochaete sordida TaxID=48140 RepID=A0A9P3LHH0_9APHY|nr:hypothetical protein PsYK624_108300 [Phanerochaete sordida]
MRVTLATALAVLCGVQSATALCCYYGSAGACRRAEGDLVLRSDLAKRAEIESRDVCCCGAWNQDMCASSCGV